MNSLLGKHWHHLSTDEVLDLLDTNIQQGLDVFEVKHRQERFGLNGLSFKRGQSPLVRFLLQFNNPLVIILLVASLVTAVLKDPADAAVIFGVVLINAIIGYIQESRAEQAIAALAKTMTTEAGVIRSGKVTRIPAAELVPGDIVQLLSGARVPADVVKLTSADTVNGKPVTIKVEDGKVYINDAQVIITDILTSNGVIHVIDSVILPPK